jgi:hypothetical protein
MQSINNLTPGARSMNGLNTLSANNIDADVLDVDVLIVNSAGTVPTRTAGDNTTNIANTAFVTAAVAGAGTNYVTLTTAQTVSGNKNFTGTNILGDVFSVDQPCKTSITNNTVADSSVKGSIGGESVYHQMRMGARGFYIGQGLTNNGRQYFGISGSGTPDPDIVMVMTENGIKVQNANVGDTTDYTEALKVVGTARVTGITTFDVSPECAVAPTTANQLVPKSYPDNNFVNLTGTQTISGNKTFTGNNVFNCATGTNTIRGNQVDIFPTITFLTSPTTSIAGTYCNMNSTNNYVGGTTTYLAATNTIINNTVNSFYIDASYNNFVGKETYINTPYFLVNTNCLNFVVQSGQTIMKSPYIAFTTDCTSLNINATNTNITGNTNMTGSVVTATTQASSDNSTKLATTAFVNSYSTANYMTLTSNQNVSGIKTYSTKQVFNAGTASSIYDNTSLTDMTIASNSAQGILSISGGKITTDTFGVRMIDSNLQLNGAFIQPNTTLATGKEPVFTFGVNQVANFSATATEATATKQINTGIFKFWCGNNQSTLFSLTHSLTNGYAIGPGPWEELEIYISWVDANTGITRLTSGNLATTTIFSMPSLGTVIRPTITFTLDTITLPEAVYNINAFVKIKTAFGSNALNTMTWNLSATPSTFTTTQNYNTAIDCTFTSRNLYHCFRNAVPGIILYNNIAVGQNIGLPIFYSISDLLNITGQPTTSGAVPTTDGGAFPGQVGVGNYNIVGCDNKDNYWLVSPGYGLIVYNATGFSGSVYINYRNKTNNPVVVAGTTISAGSSVEVYFDGVKLLAF